MLWHLGGSQSDIASLSAEDVDFQNRVISFRRMKSGSIVRFRFGEQLKELFKTLPPAGPLFPQIRGHKESDRAKQFWRSCRRLKIEGVTRHSFRYAWAELSLNKSFEYKGRSGQWRVKEKLLAVSA